MPGNTRLVSGPSGNVKRCSWQSTNAEGWNICKLQLNFVSRREFAGAPTTRPAIPISMFAQFVDFRSSCRYTPRAPTSAQLLLRWPRSVAYMPRPIMNTTDRPTDGQTDFTNYDSKCRNSLRCAAKNGTEPECTTPTPLRKSWVYTPMFNVRRA